MEFRIADTFTSSLARLARDEQKAVKTTSFDLQVDPVNPGMQLHRVDGARDKNFWSVRVSRDIRLIVHKTESSLMLCYVGHHDDAYRWAERRRLETHPRTGAAQLVEIREVVREIVTVEETVKAPPTPPAKPLLFDSLLDDELLQYGIPADWIDEVRAADEDSVLDLAEHLPAEAAEALLQLATGNRPRMPEMAPATRDPFAHPDAQRRFRVIDSIEELERALESPWDKWTVFLHPEQRESVERLYDGPARISGSAGTGKTIVALHRGVFLARSEPESRVLITTFSETLANVLQASLRRLIGNEPRLGERLDVQPLDAVALRLYEHNLGKAKLVSQDLLREWMTDASAALEGQRFTPQYLLSEWAEVVDGWQIDSWEGYRDVARLGRKTRLSEKQRQALWVVFEHVQARLVEKGLLTWPALYRRVTEHIRTSKRSPYEHVVVDEAQDVSVAQLRFLAAIGGNRPNGLFFTGDLGQRIFQSPFSWKAMGVDIRGRCRTLWVNYRTSHQIRSQADRLLEPSVADVDGNTEGRRGTVSVFNGSAPELRVLESPEAEIESVGDWLKARVKEGLKASEIAVIVRSDAEVPRGQGALDHAGIPYKVLDETVATVTGYASLCTMHLAKGLEFRAVAVMACDDEVIPLQARMEAVGDDADLIEVYNTERHLLYVACTRARDFLIVSAVRPASEFLEDLASD